MSIGDSTFSCCVYLKITVASNNANFSSKEGALFNKDGTKLIHGPGGAEPYSYIIPYGVTSIGKDAFTMHNYLTSITIPDSVTSIGDEAFSHCNKLTSIVIPEGVQSIGESSFRSCTSLNSITIPSSVTSIAYGAFANCRNINLIVAERNPNYLSENGALFDKNKTVLIRAPGSVKEYVIPSSVTLIADWAFSHCNNLISISIPEGVTSIADGTFVGCESLSSVKFPKTLRSIGESAFLGYNCLTVITIPENVTSIADAAFSHCSNLSKVTFLGIPPIMGTDVFKYTASSIIGEYPTSKVNAWETVIVDGKWNGLTMTMIEPTLFTYTVTDGKVTITGYEGTTPEILEIPSNINSLPVVAIGERAFYERTGFTSVSIPESVTSIGDYAFYNCRNLTSITISESVTSIGDYAFSYCIGLTSIVIPEGVISIGDDAFSYCSNLTSITIPESITSVNGYAFYGCSNLTSITFKGTPPSTDSNAFPATNGYYYESNRDAWTEVIVDEKWKNLTMMCVADPELLPEVTMPEEVIATEAVTTWLKEQLVQVNVTSGTVELAEGTSEETLDAARLLGVIPQIGGTAAISIFALDDTILVSGGAELQVSDIVVANEEVSLTARVVATQGATLPENYQPLMSPKLYGYTTLNGNPTEIAQTSPTGWTRMSDTTATQTISVPIGTYIFFKVVAEE